MLVKLTEIAGSGAYTRGKDAYDIQSEYFLREVFVNPEQVVLMRDDANFNKAHEKRPLMEGLRKGMGFTKVLVSAGSSQPLNITVVGSPDAIGKKLGVSR